MLRFIAIVTIAQGAIVAAVALYLIATKRTFLFRAIRTDALVVDVLTSQSTSADAMYATTLHPVVECTDDTGHSQRAEISLGMSNPSWSQGDTTRSATHPMIRRTRGWIHSSVCGFRASHASLSVCGRSSVA
jgi:hypothetical protein